MKQSHFEAFIRLTAGVAVIALTVYTFYIMSNAHTIISTVVRQLVK